MKFIITGLMLMASLSSFAESSVYCAEGVDLTLSDHNEIRVSIPNALTQSLTIKYLGANKFVQIKNGSKLRGAVKVVKALVDNGTSVKIEYKFDLELFSDGDEFLVERTLVKPDGNKTISSLSCIGAES